MASEESFEAYKFEYHLPPDIDELAQNDIDGYRSGMKLIGYMKVGTTRKLRYSSLWLVTSDHEDPTTGKHIYANPIVVIAFNAKEALDIYSSVTGDIYCCCKMELVQDCKNLKVNMI